MIQVAVVIIVWETTKWLVRKIFDKVVNDD